MVNKDSHFMLTKFDVHSVQYVFIASIFYFYVYIHTLETFISDVDDKDDVHPQVNINTFKLTFELQLKKNSPKVKKFFH